MPSVFITGSGKRLGKAMAVEFARNNWDVIVHYYNSEDSALDAVRHIQALGVRCIAVRADVQSYSELSEAFDEAVGYIGIPDVFVNNAGVFPPETSLTDIPDAQWEQVINTNLRGEYYGAKIFASHAKPGARLINIGSLGAYEIWRKRIPYNVSKAGVVQLTKALARELAPDISVNCVCPGAISMPDDPSPHDNSLIPVTRIPMKRYGTPQDVFDAVYFFATASGYITGQIITVDGGYHNSR